jgi:hypothetical protein
VTPTTGIISGHPGFISSSLFWMINVFADHAGLDRAAVARHVLAPIFTLYLFHPRVEGVEADSIRRAMCLSRSSSSSSGRIGLAR